MTTWLHEERLAAVLAEVRASGARRVVDLGCGDGDLFLRLAREPGIEALVGVDLSVEALDRLRGRLARSPGQGAQVEIRHGSMTDPAPDLAGFDCAVLVETIEHIPPDHLSRLERAVWQVMRPGVVVLTTPNAEFNPLLGVPPTRFRHPDHRFEWTREKFRAWCRRVAEGAGYSLRFADVGGLHPTLGGASQMAVFRRGVRDDTPQGFNPGTREP
jgi:small RNA 2'-O-methyltransferase